MAIYVSGNISGLGQPSYYLNLSRTQAFNPRLVCEDQPYLLGDCPITAIEYEGFSPNKIVNIRSKENDVYENTVDFHRAETLIYNGSNYPIVHYPFSATYNDRLNYLVTDKGDLFYQYELLYNAFSNVSGFVVKNIYKNNETLVDKKNYKIQYSYDLLSTGSPRYSNTTWGDIKQTDTHRVRVLLPFSFSSKKDFYVIDYDKVLNGVKTYQKELIELRPLYSSLDYAITSSGLNVSGNLNPNGLSLNLIKDPSKRVHPLDIVTLKGQNAYLSDKDAQWKLRLNVGSFYSASGFYTGSSGYLYNIENSYSTIPIPLTNIKPSMINKNIIQVKETPIYINESVYTYPTYRIDLYEKNNSGLYDASGKFAVDINGVTRSDIKIKSIDREKGFIELNTSLNTTDEVELSFYLSNSGFIVLENLELNPKISTSGGFAYHINNYPNGLGIALPPFNATNNYKYPFIYDLSKDPSSRTVSGIFDVGDASTYSESWDNKFLSICEIDLNKLTPDMVKITDARRVGGGVVNNKLLEDWFSSNLSGIYSYEKNWYTDIGQYDGAPLSNSSLVIIHVPNDIITSAKQQWINYFKTYTTIDDSEILAEKEFKHYLDQTIRRYISAGTDYIIMPTVSGQVLGTILNLGH